MPAPVCYIGVKALRKDDDFYREGTYMLNNLWTRLQLFAEGGMAGGSAPGGDSGESGSGLSGDFDSDMRRYFGVSASSAAGNGSADDGEKEQEAAEAGSVTGEAADAKAASSGQQEPDDDGYSEFREKYKDKIHADFQKSFNERFKKAKETETQLQAENRAYREIIAPLIDKYGLDENATPEDIASAIKGDNTIFSRQAMAAGMSTDAYRDRFFELQAQKAAEEQRAAEAKQAQAEQAAQQRQQAMRQTYERWKSESDELKKSFPSFDLAAELKGNAAFRTALEAGLPVAQAFYGANFDKISSGLVAAASQNAAKKAAQTVAANRARPSEGGQNSGTGIRTGTVDVASMTGQQIRDLMARAERGEKIVL